MTMGSGRGRRHALRLAREADTARSSPGSVVAAMPAANCFDDLLRHSSGDGAPLPAAIERVATAYLDGRPQNVGKKKLTKKVRDSLFWSSKVVKGPGLQPHLFERPVLEFGARLVQLPWVVGLQNNSAAAINNLRRLGARRGQARDEARRIEAGLARLMEARGFKTLLNWKPPREVDDAGEVDLIATLGKHLFVIEVKSTFLRRSQREAWLHATTALRKAGDQLRRKVDAVALALVSDPELRALLDLTEDRLPTCRHGWIADTSIECDHQRFGGFLKVSIEELLIALRDDRHVLNDPEGLLDGNYREGRSREADTRRSAWTLYPDGFSAERFIEVIEAEAVWDLCDRTQQRPGPL